MSEAVDQNRARLETLPPSAVTETLMSLGWRKGDIAFVHSDAMIVAHFPPMPKEQRLDALIAAMEAALGSEGTLVMPTFTYSFTKGECFDVLSTPSKVGMLTERFRTRAGVCRSADPIFSIAAKGPRAEELCALPVKECFGAESVFAALHRMNAHLTCVGCSLNQGGTFVHYVERAHGVNYRYDKTFPGNVIMPDGKSSTRSVVYYVRDLTRKSGYNLRRLQARLEAEGKLRRILVGRAPIVDLFADDFFTVAWKMLDEDPVALIEEGAQPR